MRRATLAPALLLAACGGGTVVAVVAPTPDVSASSVCATVLTSLPKDLTTALPMLGTSPVSPLVRAWGTGKTPVVLTCGIPTPTTVTDTYATTVDGLSWGTPFGVDDVYRTRDRTVPVQVQIPDGVIPFDVLAGVSMQILAADPVDPVIAASEAAVDGTGASADPSPTASQP